ncbi:TetR/AcrR family transcriptional regulator [Actinomycetospora sp. OC33-EN08]|uniref:TetR/AcrR family transcriptional regulator n=1 Tax=Actinomycetospora aurantiaca TaxID=3129233 RepID=A0ABU8MXY7_9PSEU
MPQRSHRAAILATAESLLRRDGPAAVSVADITTAAGVPKGSFYNHFESKEALLAEIVEQYGRGIDLTTLDGPGSAPERLRAHFAACAERLTTDTGFGSLLAGAAAGTPVVRTSRVLQSVRVGLAVWSRAVAAVVAEGQEQGDFRPGRSASEIASALIETFEGAAVLARATRDHAAPSRHVALLIDALRAP